MKQKIFQVLGAVPAFNFYNLESLRAIERAANGKPVIYAVSESAMDYMGDEFLRWAAKTHYLHLDHGHSLESVRRAIRLGFRSVMIDGSALPFAENLKLTRRVVWFAHWRRVFVEAELGALCGFEDENTTGGKCEFTMPKQAKAFVRRTHCDSLAIAIGTSHGAYKGNGKLRFDILAEIHKLLPKIPLVLHGASQIPAEYAKILGLKQTSGIAAAQIRKAIKLGIKKVNVDSDARLAWTATMKKQLAGKTTNFDPRCFLSAAADEMIKLYKTEIKLISGK